MWKQIRLITDVHIKSFFGFNESKYSKVKKKKKSSSISGVGFVILGLVLMLYVGMFSFGISQIGLADLIPTFLFTITALVIFFFSLFKANVIFDVRSFEKEIPLPMPINVIVISRYLTIYLLDLLLSAAVMLPGSIFFIAFGKPTASGIVMLVLSLVFQPLLPLTLGVAIGSVILAISSGMKHKNAISVVLSIIVLLGIVIAPYALSSNQDISVEQITSLANTVGDSIGRMYPLALLYSAGVVNGNIFKWLLFAAISVVVLYAFQWVTSRYYKGICTKLKSHIASTNFVMSSQQSHTSFSALYKKEIKRYFASNSYVLNTIFGYVIAVIFAVAIVIVGKDKIGDLLNMGPMVGTVAPLIITMFCAMSSTTTCAISIEGKQWWIPQTLPVNAADIYKSKLLVNFTVATPAVIVSAVLVCIAMRDGFMNSLWIFAIPLVYVVFSTVFGLFINIKFPVFEWDNEMAVVKQSTATTICVFSQMFGVIITLGISFVFSGVAKSIYYAVLCAVLLGVSALIYKSILKTDLQKIGK